MHFQIPPNPETELIHIRRAIIGTGLKARYVAIEDKTKGFASIDYKQVQDGDARRFQIYREESETRDLVYTDCDGNRATETVTEDIVSLLFSGFNARDVIEKYEDSKRVVSIQERSAVQIPEGAVNCFLKG